MRKRIMRLPNALFKRRPSVLFVLAASAVIASLCAIWSISSVTLLPPKLESRDLRISGATTAVLVDLPRSTLSDPRTGWSGSVSSLTTRAALLARLATTQPALQYIGSAAGVSPGRIAAVTPFSPNVPYQLLDGGSEQRAWQLVLAARPYNLSVQPKPDLPIIEIYCHAPSPDEAARLAEATVSGLRRYLEVLASGERVNGASQVSLRQLGPVRAGFLNGGNRVKIVVLTFLFAFAASWGVLLVLARLLYRRTTKEAQVDGDSLPRPSPASSLRSSVTFGAPWSRFRLWAPVSAPGGAEALAVQPWRLHLPVRPMVSYGGDWPRTTRVMPWMLALFIAVLWLVPFDSIALNVSMPVDMKFDRIVLPFVAGTWLLLLAVGGRGAPRIRGTFIHAAVILFVAFAFLSVLLNVAPLTQSLEIDTSFKKLPLLLSYLSLFFMVSSVIRLSEVRAFLTYTLLLAVLCAIGMIVEFKTQYNVFFELSKKLLPGVFKVTMIKSGWSVDRVTTHGPTMHGLAAATMLAMAFAIAIVRLIHAERGRARVLHGLAAGVLFVAMLATQKKTAMLAPISGLLALTWFRPREMRKLAPAATVAVIALVIVSPGTIEPVIKQFSPRQLGAGAPTTTTDRASQWDAVRPEVWTHLLIGRGYGSYQPLGHRVLDSELLSQTIETGLLGLASFFLLGASILVTARAAIRHGDATRAPPALVGAAAAVIFLVVAPLFDSLSFPQGPYIFFYLAALVAVAARPDDGWLPANNPRIHTSGPEGGWSSPGLKDT